MIDSNSYKKLEQEIMQMLRDKLPAQLHYHSAEHIRDVIAAAENISIGEGLNEEDTNLVKTAALFHDSGFTLSTENHEEIGCQIAREVLKKKGYEDSFIVQVCNMIIATKIPQAPKDKLSEVLCDADLDYLGRSDFFEISNRLYQEWKAMGKVGGVKEWNLKQVSFFNSHHYFTQTSIKMRSLLKQKHLDALHALIKE